MFSLHRFGIKLGLGTTRNILKGLGNPQNRFASIHVAGTNGKGSIAAGIASVLKAAGYRVGLYTSPHLVRFNERIQVNGREISNKQVVEAYNAVRSVHHGSREPTFFEFATAMALYTFCEQHVDWAVIETGMGGRLDATNIVQPAVSVISNISLEHKFYLGNTIAEIAAEKAGIIKRGVPVVTAAKQKPALQTITSIARSRRAPLFLLGRDFRVRRNPNGGFSYYGLEHSWKDLATSLIGRHQVDNAAVALAVCEILIQKGTAVGEDEVRRGMRSIQWPGRLEIAAENPTIILDGAHNLVAARTLAEFLKTRMAARRIVMVLGMLDDKPYRAMLQTLAPLADRLVLTRPVIDRALEPQALFEAAKGLQENIDILPDVPSAVKHAVEIARPDDGVCIAGSLYVVGEAKEALAAMGLAS
jgi:dihydrofolate synthase/folylpolyglutamate synthase